MAFVEMFILVMPNVGRLPALRVWYWRKKGFSFGKTCFLGRNVIFLGKVFIGEGSSISDNCFLSGSEVGISIGNKVMIAPNCVLVAFDHGCRDLEIPMIDQPCVDGPIVIEDDVWIAANCTITKGVRLGKGCVVGANSVVTKNVEPFVIAAGVPAKAIGDRKKRSK